MSVSISRLVEPCLARRFFRRASSAPACFLKMSPNTTAATGQPSKWGMSVVMMAFQKSNIPEVYRLASTRHVEQAQPGQSTRRQHPCWLQCYGSSAILVKNCRNCRKRSISRLSAADVRRPRPYKTSEINIRLSAFATNGQYHQMCGRANVMPPPCKAMQPPGRQRCKVVPATHFTRIQPPVSDGFRQSARSQSLSCRKCRFTGRLSARVYFCTRITKAH